MRILGQYKHVDGSNYIERDRFLDDYKRDIVTCYEGDKCMHYVALEKCGTEAETIAEYLEELNYSHFEGGNEGVYILVAYSDIRGSSLSIELVDEVSDDDKGHGVEGYKTCKNVKALLYTGNINDIVWGV